MDTLRSTVCRGVLLLFICCSAVLAPSSRIIAASNTEANPGQSYNWSGYIASQGSYTGITGTWSVPAVSFSSDEGLAADATWVGIGGLSSTDLIQMGTEAVVNGTVATGNNVSSAPRTLTYEAWYEFLPDNGVVLPIAVHAGDTVSASIVEQSQNQWLLTFDDITTGQLYSTVQTYNSLGGSAEWIEEMPTNVTNNDSAFLPLDDFNTVQFSRAMAISDGTSQLLGQLGATPLTMISSPTTSYTASILAQPSAIGSDNQSFSISRTNSISGVPATSPTPASTFRITYHGGRHGIPIDIYIPL